MTRTNKILISLASILLFIAIIGDYNSKSEISVTKSRIILTPQVFFTLENTSDYERIYEISYSNDSINCLVKFSFPLDEKKIRQIYISTPSSSQFEKYLEDAVKQKALKSNSKQDFELEIKNFHINANYFEFNKFLPKQQPKSEIPYFPITANDWYAEALKQGSDRMITYLAYSNYLQLKIIANKIDPQIVENLKQDELELINKNFYHSGIKQEIESINILKYNFKLISKLN